MTTSIPLPSLTGVNVDTTPPALTGLTDMSGNSAVMVQSWSWGCSDVSPPCVYRYAFSESSGHQFQDSDRYGTGIEADTPTSESGLWYLHIQARDHVGNESSIDSYGVKLDNGAPLLANENIGVPSGGTYSDHLDFTVKFNEEVSVDISSGIPRLAITVGGSTRYANYMSGAGGRTLTFRYVIQGGDSDGDGVDLASSVDLNGGSIKDGAQNLFDASATLQIPSLSGVRVEKLKEVIISESNFVLGEVNGVGSYTVALSAVPVGGDVVVTVTNPDSSALRIVPPSLTFNTSSWNQPQTVRVTTIDNDVDIDVNLSLPVIHSVAGGGYNSVSVASLLINITDDDTAGVTLAGAPLTIGESGSGSYSVVLESEPSGMVTVNVSSGDTNVVTVNPPSLTFTSSDWNTSKMVTVRGVGDSIDNDPDRTAIITHAITGGGYVSVNVDDVNVTLTDDDTRGVGVSTAALSVGENGQMGNYTVVLESEPTGTVTVSVSSGDTNIVTVSPPSLTFSSSDWGTPKRVDVTTVNDDIDNDPDRTATITHTVSGAGTDYASGVSASGVVVTATDDDTRGVGGSTAALSVGEDGRTQIYTVVLESEPTGNVTVNVSSGDLNVVTVSPSSLIFTSSDWDTVQEITVTTVNDDINNDPDRTATISHTVSGGGYDSVSVGNVVVTATDDDELAVEITGPSGPLNGNIDLTITFTEAVSNFAKGDITISSGTLGVLNDDGSGVFTIALTPAANTDGAVTVDINADVATGMTTSAGNMAAIQYSVEVDNVGPGILQQNIGVLRMILMGQGRIWILLWRLARMWSWWEHLICPSLLVRGQQHLVPMRVLLM